MQLWHELLLYLKIYLYSVLEQHRMRLIPLPGSYYPFFSLNSLGGSSPSMVPNPWLSWSFSSVILQPIKVPSERCAKAGDSVQCPDGDSPAGPHAGDYHSMNVDKDGAVGSHRRPLPRALPFHLSRMNSSPKTW